MNYLTWRFRNGRLERIVSSVGSNEEIGLNPEMRPEQTHDIDFTTK